MASKKFFSIEFQGAKDTIDQLAKIELEMKKLADQIREAKKLGKEDVYKDLRFQQENLKKTATELRAELRNSVREFEKSKFPTDSIVGLEHAYSKLRTEIRGMSKEMRESAEGIQKIRFAEHIKNQIDKTSQSFGDWKSQIGSYKKSILEAGDVISGGLLTGGVAAGVGLAVSVVSDLFQKGTMDIKEYETALADLAAVLGLSGDELKKFEEAALSLQVIEVGGQKIINTGKDLFEAFKLVGSAIPELLKSDEALKSVAKSAIVLQEAAGGTLAENVDATTGVMQQFNLAASESDRIINLLAAGSKEGAAEIDDIKSSIKEFGAVADLSNVSVEQSVALVEILATKSIKGSEAGTKLRNVLLKISQGELLPKKAQDQLEKAGVNMAVLSDKTVDFSVKLKELQKLSGNVDAIGAVFNPENVDAAATLIESGGLFDQLTKKITGTSEAYTQAAVRADTLEQKQKNLSAAFTNFLTKEGGSGTEILKDAYEALADALIELGVILDPLTKSFHDLEKSISDIGKTIGADTENFSLLGTLLNWLLNPIRIASYAITTLANAFSYLFDKANSVLKSLPFLTAGIKAVAGFFKGKGNPASPAPDTSVSNEELEVLKSDLNKIQKEKDAAAKVETEKQKAAREKREADAKAAREKAAAEELKAVKEQYERIANLRLKINELNAREINNIFDRELAQVVDRLQKESNKLQEQKEKLNSKIKGQKGGATATDNEEASLIQSETDAIAAALETQKAVIEKKRQEAFDEAKKQLLRLQNENLKAIEENAVQIARASVAQIRTEFSNKEDGLNIQFNSDVAGSKASLLAGEINQSQYNKRIISLTNKLNADKLQLTKDAAAAEAAVRDQLYKEQLEQIKLLNRIDIQTVEDSADDKKRALDKQFQEGKISWEDYAASIEEIQKNTAAKSDEINQSSLDKEKQLLDQKVQDEKAAAKEVAAAQEKLDDEALQRLEKQKEERIAVLNAALDIAGQLSDALFEIGDNKREAAKENELKNIDEVYKHRIELAQGNATIQEALRVEADKKKEEAEREAFERSKKAQVTQALINAALGAIAVFAVPDPTFGVLSAIRLAVIAASAAIEIAKIKSQTFAYGGFTGKGAGKPDHTGHVPVGVVHANEYVAPASQIERNPDLFHFLEADRLQHLRGFATGGFTTPPQIAPTRSSDGAINPESAGMIGDVIAAKVYEAAKKGTEDGTRSAQSESFRFLELRKSAKINSTF